MAAIYSRRSINMCLGDLQELLAKKVIWHEEEQHRPRCGGQERYHEDRVDGHDQRTLATTTSTKAEVVLLLNAFTTRMILYNLAGNVVH
jgi:hypothetical protein